MTIAAAIVVTAAMLDHGVLSWERAVLVAASVALVIVVVKVIAGPGGQRAGKRLRAWVRRIVEAHEGGLPDAADHDDAAYWFVPIAAGALLVGLLLAGWAVIELLDISFGAAWPWLLVGLAVLAFVIALIAVSYAPPGPNWVERISGIDGSALLIMVGIAIVSIGTLEYFEFDEAGAAPSDWWLAVVGIGMLSGVIGVSRAPRPPRRDIATLADRAATEAEEYARRSAEIMDTATAAAPASEARRVGDHYRRSADAAKNARAGARSVRQLQTKSTRRLATVRRNRAAARNGLRGARRAAVALRRTAVTATPTETDQP